MYLEGHTKGHHMATSATELLEQALKLEAQDRALIAERLQGGDPVRELIRP